jgi:hypothetical protein
VYKRTLPPAPSSGWFGFIVNSRGSVKTQTKGADRFYQTQTKLLWSQNQWVKNQTGQRQNLTRPTARGDAARLERLAVGLESGRDTQLINYLID